MSITVNDLIKHLTEQVTDDPSIGNLRVIYAKDDEGNEFHPVLSSGIMYVEDDDCYYIEPLFEVDGGVPVYCIN